MKRTKDRPITEKPVRAFALAELMVAVAIISVLAIAVGSALNFVHLRRDQAKTTLSQIQQDDDLLWRMSEEFQWATHISLVSSNSIALVSPDSDGPGSTTFSYSFFGDVLYRSVNGAPHEIFAQDVYVFNIGLDVIQDGGDTRVRAVEMTIQSGPDISNRISRYIYLINAPIRP